VTNLKNYTGKARVRADPPFHTGRRGNMSEKGVQEGMTVRSSDGEKLGKIVSCEADRFIIEKGFFFPKEYLAHYDDVAEIRGDEVLLRYSGDQLRQPSAEAGGARPERVTGAAASTTEQVKVPLVEEELSAEKRVKEAGEVKVRKEVTTERRDVSVPVTKEEIRVEHAPAAREAKPGEATFREQEVSVPLREEEVEIKKRPVVREEVAVSKTGRQEEVRASEELRKEKADVEKTGDVEGPERREPRE
jgi:uncharacterized protein (TIGR02271 family)